MKKYYNLLTAFLIITPIYIGAQNLVINGSFEDGVKCDGETEQTSIPTDWVALAGAPSFINPSCQMSLDQKSYIQGMKLPNPAAGKVYAGMGIDIEGEYLQGKLLKPLEANMRYSVKIRTRLPIRFCNTPIDELGIVLTDSNFAAIEGYITIDMPSLKLLNNDQSPIKEQNQWQEISAVYTAKGGETFIMIGNFKDNNVSNFKKRMAKAEKPENEENEEVEEKKGKLCTYIYLDMVSLEEFKEISIKNYNPGSDLKKGERLILKDVEFETGLEKLKGESFTSLDALAKQLVEKPNLQLEISGHTDNTGDENTNRIFSKSRAQSVASYLISKGAKASQLVVEGKGSGMNLAQNSSEANRKKNRRIEIKIIEE